MGVIVIYLRIRNRFSFLDVTVRIGSCSHSCSLLNSTKGSKKKKKNSETGAREEIEYEIGRKYEELLLLFYLLLLLELLRRSDPKEVSQGSGDNPGS